MRVYPNWCLCKKKSIFCGPLVCHWAWHMTTLINIWHQSERGKVEFWNPNPLGPVFPCFCLFVAIQVRKEQNYSLTPNQWCVWQSFGPGFVVLWQQKSLLSSSQDWGRIYSETVQSQVKLKRLFFLLPCLTCSVTQPESGTTMHSHYFWPSRWLVHRGE